MTTSKILPELEPLAVPIENLRPMEGNPRKGDVDAVARSYERWGQRKPIVARRDPRSKKKNGSPTGEVVAGNHQLEAAKKLGWTEIAVVFVDESRESANAYALADNRTSDLATYDDEALAELLRELSSDDELRELLEAASWDDDAIAEVLSPVPTGATDPDAVPAKRKRPTTSPGDLYLLGEHRLLCGDATQAEDVERVLAGERPALMVTDPPYGVGYDPAWRQREAAKGHLAYAARRVGEVPNDDRTDWSEAWLLSPSDVAYCWSPPGSSSIVTGQALLSAGFEIRNQIIWSKPHFPIGRGHYHYRHEPCWYAVRSGGDARWCGDRKQTTVWEVTLDANVPGGHSAQKPVELFERAIRNHRGDVYDPFVGSGTSLIAAEATGRSCYAMDIDPGYVDVAVARWEAFTGRKAKRERP